MSLTLTPISLADGIWTASVTGTSEPPRLEIRIGEQALESPLLEARADGSWLLQLRVPADAINDGVTVLSVHHGDDRLGGFIVAAGDLLQNDLRAEVALLRAEVDLLKATIRRLHRSE